MPFEISRVGVNDSGGREVAKDLGGVATTGIGSLGGGGFKSGIPLSVFSSATGNVKSSKVTSAKRCVKAEALLRQVQELLEKGVIERVANASSPGFYSRFFVVPKREPGKWRAILDLSVLNNFIRKEKFKMETVEAIRSQLKVGEFVASIDLSDAYHHVPIHPKCRKFLRFVVEGQQFQYRALYRYYYYRWG